MPAREGLATVTACSEAAARADFKLPENMKLEKRSGWPRARLMVQVESDSENLTDSDWCDRRGRCECGQLDRDDRDRVCPILNLPKLYLNLLKSI